MFTYLPNNQPTGQQRQQLLFPLLSMVFPQLPSFLFRHQKCCRAASLFLLFVANFRFVIVTMVTTAASAFSLCCRRDVIVGRCRSRRFRSGFKRLTCVCIQVYLLRSQAVAVKSGRRDHARVRVQSWGQNQKKLRYLIVRVTADYQISVQFSYLSSIKG